ncbi:MAG: NAD-dependent deacylase, partial [Anaerolineae bacterium]|nr:NAD-dependent deacylase [Anaerolineae bacterium]
GLWEQYDPRQLATPAAFESNPKLVWDFYEMRRERMRPAQPNPGHVALASIERLKGSLPIITQNVDDLHERGGSTQVIHLHGLIAHNRCSRDCQGSSTLIDVSQLSWERTSGPPPCPYCGAYVRPDVVWFGEMLPRAPLERAYELAGTCDLMIVVGTSGIVTPAADMPRIARRQGATLIEINPYASDLTPTMDIWLQAPSGETLPCILAAMERP